MSSNGTATVPEKGADEVKRAVKQSRAEARRKRALAPSSALDPASKFTLAEGESWIDVEVQDDQGLTRKVGRVGVTVRNSGHESLTYIPEAGRIATLPAIAVYRAQEAGSI